ncbi:MULTISPECIES: amino acid adenylation domain-containing protein [Actinosynnema]|uniref:non-ribosomal peptide synthetase n=1 Tax=Actinosynnema TaxID=40566 RepID=UPI0020A5408D|nr:amino acid adenylation domain-containing protein [Actinosynnema pretiosum]MCP2097812.1 amino acid adenylation domain-containing protein [Actinosynnema pretiosum]
MTELDVGAQALWMLQQLVPDRGVSNVAVGVELDRTAQWWPLQEAANWLVARHPALRRSFPAADGVPVVREHAPEQVELRVDVHGTDEARLEQDLREFAARPFDLSIAPLVRIGLFTGAPKQVICVVAHHIGVDAVSLGTLAADLGRAYHSLREGNPPDVPPLDPALVITPGPAALDFWREHVAGFDAAGMRLAEARPVGADASFGGEMIERVFPAAAVDWLASLRRQCRVTDAIALLTAYFVTLRGHGAAADALVGVMVNTRAGRAADAVGYHVVTLPVRAAVEDDRTFAELARRVADVMVTGMDRAAVPFEVLAQEAVQDPHDPLWWRSRLVRHLFNFRPGQGDYRPLGTGSLFRDVCTGLSRFDLELSAERVGDELVVKLLHSTEVHDTPFAERFLDRLELVLRTAAADPGRRVGDFDLRTDRDRWVVEAANDTRREWPAPHTVPGMVLAAAEPRSVAVVDSGRRTTYASFLGMVWSVREQVLGHLGADPGVVAIAAPRGIGAAAAVFGVWAAGAAYLPLDPDHPAERLRWQLDELRCRVVIGGESLPEEVREGRVCLAVPAWDTEAGAGAVGPLPEPSPDDVAYVIFTSGSTGRPKGVRISHGNLANVVRHFVAALALDRSAAVAWLTTFAFDISALELCLPLAVGGRLVVAPDSARAEPGTLLELVERESVTVVQATPTTWRVAAPLAEGRLAGRTLLCGGEPLIPDLARWLLATGAWVHNVYGPTETTIWSTSAELTDPDADVTVGVPIANTVVTVLNRRGRPQPVGLPGELCIGGLGVAIDYHDRPELTARCFRKDELGRYYRTGDQARWRADGTLDLLGRDDRQVKLRAHRIELGEVESVLREHPDVVDAAVTAHGDLSGDGVLVAHVVAVARPGLDEDLWRYASRRLPGYSVPAGYAVLDALPVTANGKVDHRALAERPLPLAERSSASDATDTHQDDLRAALTDLWRRVLRKDSLGPHANFFLSGGTSLLAVRLAAQASARCGTTVSMGMVFRAPTPAALAAAIESAVAEPVAAP